ncbi:MAG: 50S ribosomal protein L11 methyltransferase [Desulfobacterales bacterium]
MRWIEAKVFFEADEPFWGLEIISNIFQDLCTQGVVVEDPTAQPHERWGADAQKPFDHFAVTGYFPENRQGRNRCRLLEEKLSGLKGQYNLSVRIVYQTIDEQDWANSWKIYFRPQKIGEQIVVKPTWHHYSPEPGEIVLEIDPGMAFGTGTHPTTAMCVRMLERYLKKNDLFLDVGTGSGILMITAHRLGSSRTTGVDRDETAVVVARQNLLRNNVPIEKFSLIVGNLTESIRAKFHVAAANILSEAVVLLLDEILEMLVPGGLFIASGIIEDNRDLVIQKMREKGFRILHTELQDQWVAIVGRNEDQRSIHFRD